jgi:signal transduction histidine kinase
MTFLAFALLGVVRGETGQSRITSLLGLLVGLLTLVALLVPDSWIGMFSAPAIVTVILLAAGSALTAGAWGPPQVRQISLGIGGLVLAAIGGASFFVRLMGSADIVDGRGLGIIPWPLALGVMAFGIVAVTFGWRDGPKHAVYPDWVLAGVLTSGLVASTLVWRALESREEAQLDALTQQSANTAALSMRRRLESIGAALHQFALGHGAELGDPYLALAELKRDTPATEVLAIIDSSGHPTLTLPLGASVDALLATVPQRTIPLPETGRAPVEFIAIPGDSTHLVIHAARCAAGACPGGVAAIMNAENQLQRMAVDRRGWDFEVSTGPFAPAELEDNSGRTASVGLPGVDWWLVARPSLEMIGTARSSVPEMALILGLVLTALLTGTIRISGTAWENARAVERLRITSAITRATDAVWEWEIGSGRMHRSAEHWRHLGYDPATLNETLDEWLGLVHPEDSERLTEALAGLADPEVNDFEIEYRVRTRSGDWHTVVDRGRVIEFDLSGSASRVMGMTADVTRSRRAEAELREVEALSSMGRVAARVAHEINNPLAGIRSAFSLIKDAVPPDHPHRHYVGAIEREVDRIASVTRQLYEVYRPEPEAGHASLGTIAKDAVALLEQVNRTANVSFNVRLDGVPSVVPVSGGLLRQIVYNLVQNAVDASPTGGTVDVLARMEADDLVLEVHDQGPGVPEALRERIFEPFFTTKDASVRTGGMGLGLSMVSRSVAAANGAILVDDAPGGGARFTVRLPLSNGGPA